MTGPRIALLGFSIECNRFAPVATAADFHGRTLVEGPAMVEDARSPAPHMLGELPGFIADMDAAGPWQPVPILLAMAEPGGPVEHGFFMQLMQSWEDGLRAAGGLDGVYLVLHGAGLTTVEHDPEGLLLTLVRRMVGPDVPVVATYDLHANVSDADVTLVNAFIGYRTNPHLDMRERGAEAAQTLRRLLDGTRTFLARLRLPIVPPTVTQLTAKDAPHRPYGELIDLGQERMQEPPYRGRVLNVSVMGGFAFADTPFNGLTIVVTATDQVTADGLAREIAEAGWARRNRFDPTLTSLQQAVERARATQDRTLHPLVFADVADNPGGGGRGNTMWILQAFLEAGVRDALVGVIHDPALAAEAHALGDGASFVARFNRSAADTGSGNASGNGGSDQADPAARSGDARSADARSAAARSADSPSDNPGGNGGLDHANDGGDASLNNAGDDAFSRPFAAPATVRRLRDGSITGRRGIYANNTLAIGPSVALQLDGITVVVLSQRYQCADPAFFEAFGLDIAAARVVVVKSRGHFRGGFDEFFRHQDVVEVDAPGLTSPILSRFPWKHLPRPVLPIDPTANWTPPE